MIRLVPDPTFEALVHLTVPGQPDPVEVPMVFRHMTAEQFAAWFKANEGKKSADALDKLIKEWRGVMAVDGTDVPYTLKALGTLLAGYPTAVSEIIRAYRAELFESKVKN